MVILRRIRIATFVVFLGLTVVALQTGVFADDDNTIDEQCALMGCSGAVQRCKVGGQNGLMQCTGCGSQETFDSACTQWCSGQSGTTTSNFAEGWCRCPAGSGCGIIGG